MRRRGRLQLSSSHRLALCTILALCGCGWVVPIRATGGSRPPSRVRRCCVARRRNRFGGQGLSGSADTTVSICWRTSRIADDEIMCLTVPPHALARQTPRTTSRAFERARELIDTASLHGREWPDRQLLWRPARGTLIYRNCPPHQVISRFRGGIDGKRRHTETFRLVPVGRGLNLL